MQKIILLFILITGFASCTSNTKESCCDSSTKAKFEPEDGKCLVFIGQDLGAIGGLEEYSDGYCDYFAIPGGITTYTSFSPNTESYGYMNQGNDGVFTMANWGSGDVWADLQMKSEKFNNCALAIGLAIVDNEKAIAMGERDSLVVGLGTYIKSLAPRPVYLRIGYEFDGHSWNHYDQNFYTKAFRYIVDKFAQMGIDNVAFVWQSKGNGTTAHEMQAWYPGDKYVDWCGYSFFSNPDQEMIKFARQRNKPVFIAEATPMFNDGDKEFYDTFMDNPENAKKIWDEWFTEFFKVVNENEDVVKAFSYINVDWPSQAMWVDNPYFNKVDSRIQKSDFVSKKWKEEISSDKYLLASPDLFEKLGN